MKYYVKSQRSETVNGIKQYVDCFFIHDIRFAWHVRRGYGWKSFIGVTDPKRNPMHLGEFVVPVNRDNQMYIETVEKLIEWPGFAKLIAHGGIQTTFFKDHHDYSYEISREDAENIGIDKFISDDDFKSIKPSLEI